VDFGQTEGAVMADPFVPTGRFTPGIASAGRSADVGRRSGAAVGLRRGDLILAVAYRELRVAKEGIDTDQIAAVFE
jgi:hypothetical protein